MTPEDFTSDAPGKIVRSVLGHWTFVPDPLPPKLSFDLSLAQRLAAAERAIGELASFARLLPNPSLLFRPFLGREAVLSSQIEGTVTRLDQLFLFDIQPDEEQIPPDAQEVQNYVLALEQGWQRVATGHPITRTLIEDLHRILMNGVRGAEKRPGELRDRPVLIGKRGQSYDDARFVPPCHTAIAPMVGDLVAFLRQPPDMPLVALLALVHYQFETIHPFNDGNGRLGRLLIPLILLERGVLPAPLLYLSAFFEMHQQEYYDHLLDVSRTNGWTGWIAFFAQGITEQARDAAHRAVRLFELLARYKQVLASATRSAVAVKLVESLFERPFLTIPAAIDISKTSFKSTANQIDALVRVGILRETTGQKRNRIFVADEILRLLDAPLAPEESESA